MKPEPFFLAVDCETLPWLASPNAKPDGAEQTLRYRRVVHGGGGLPSVSLTEYSPGHVEPRHRHLDNEVLQIFQGEVEIEGVIHRAPTVIYVARGTLYGPLKAGPQGMKFFRVGYTTEMLAVPEPA